MSNGKGNKDNTNDSYSADNLTGEQTQICIRKVEDLERGTLENSQGDKQ